MNRRLAALAKKAELERKLAETGVRRAKVEGFIRNLYEDFADGVFSEKEYLEMKSEYVAELDSLGAEGEELEAVIQTYSVSYGGRGEMAAAFTKYIGVDELSRELAQTFIKKIICYSRTRFEVEYAFADGLKELVDLIGKREADTA